MSDHAPPPLSPEQRVEFNRRRRARNWAILIALLALVTLFYFLSIARMTGG